MVETFFGERRLLVCVQAVMTEDGLMLPLVSDDAVYVSSDRIVTCLECIARSL